MDKTRNLPIDKFFKELQYEYIEAEIRNKIYPNKQDKAYHEKVMQGKKEKILNIANRNQFDHLFNSPEAAVEVYSKVINKYGFPNFIYKSTKALTTFAVNDKLHYYAVGSFLKVLCQDGKMHFGKLYDVDFENNIVYVEFQGTDAENGWYGFDFVARVL